MLARRITFAVVAAALVVTALGTGCGGGGGVDITVDTPVSLDRTFTEGRTIKYDFKLGSQSGVKMTAYEQTVYTQTELRTQNTFTSVTPEEATIAFLWEPRSLYCERNCLPDSILDTFGHLQYQHGSADDIASSLVERGASHVLIFEKGLSLVLEENSPTNVPLPEPEVLTDLRENNLELISTVGDGWYSLYQIKGSE